MLTAMAMVPTYNESENIASLIKDILGLDPSYGVVVVDVDSPLVRSSNEIGISLILKPRI